MLKFIIYPTRNDIRMVYQKWIRVVSSSSITSLTASYCDHISVQCSSCYICHRVFSLLPPASLSLSFPPEYVPHLWALWWCFSAQNGFTSSKTSLLYLYFTTPLETHASWAAEVWAEKRKKGGGGRVRIDWAMEI